MFIFIFDGNVIQATDSDMKTLIKSQWVTHQVFVPLYSVLIHSGQNKMASI